MRPIFCLIGLLCVGVALADSYDEPEIKSKYDEPEPEYKSTDYSDKTPDYPTPEYPTLKYHTSHSRPYNPSPAPFLYSFNRVGPAYLNNKYPRIPSPYPGIPFTNLLRGAANSHAYVPTPAPYVPAPYEPTPAPYEPTPAPYVPAPYEPTPAPYEPTPAPYEPTPAPYQPTPSSYVPTPKPYVPTPEPYEAKSDSYEPKSDSYEPKSDSYEPSPETHELVPTYYDEPEPTSYYPSMHYSLAQSSYPAYPSHYSGVYAIGNAEAGVRAGALAAAVGALAASGNAPVTNFAQSVFSPAFVSGAGAPSVQFNGLGETNFAGTGIGIFSGLGAANVNGVFNQGIFGGRGVAEFNGAGQIDVSTFPNGLALGGFNNFAGNANFLGNGFGGAEGTGSWSGAGLGSSLFEGVGQANINGFGNTRIGGERSAAAPIMIGLPTQHYRPHYTNYQPVHYRPQY